MCGESNQAKKLLEEIGKRFPADTLINELWLPTIRAAVELQRGSVEQAVAQLQSTSRYEAAAEFWPQYLRGLALLRERSGSLAAAEFEKILNNRGQAPLSALYPLAQLGLARATALTGERTKSRSAYQEFLRLWRDADQGIPTLQQAQQEYERLR